MNNRRDGKMIKYNTQVKRVLSVEELSESFINEFVELDRQYYRDGKNITIDGFYIFISEEGQKAKLIRFEKLEYKKFLKKGLSSVHVTKSKRNVFLGVDFSSTDGENRHNDLARDLVGFSSSY